MTNLCIIPARGGSKRIPRKNIKEFCGLPMIARSIQAAKDSAIFDKVIVSTDDCEISYIAQSFGAEVPFLRPKNLSDDYTSTAKVITHTYQEAKRHYSCDFSAICCLYATAPFVVASDLKNAWCSLDDKTDFVVPVTSFPFPIQRAVYKKDNFILPFSNKDMVARSQDLVEAFHDAGQFYFGTPLAWQTYEADIWKAKVKPFLLPRKRVQDIDTPEDWAVAETLYYLLTKEERIREVL